jgi:hypothetical protein
LREKTRSLSFVAPGDFDRPLLDQIAQRASIFEHHQQAEIIAQRGAPSDLAFEPGVSDRSFVRYRQAQDQLIEAVLEEVAGEMPIGFDILRPPIVFAAPVCCLR